MALVMLPCDLPWWSVVQRKLSAIRESNNLDEIIEIMLKIHDLCNVSLDPDEDNKDTRIFDGLRNYIENDMTADQREHFLSFTLKNLTKHAHNLKLYRPARGLEFSLQQQCDNFELNYNLIASLLANAFFSTLPKRTEKTHPTLQDFNFTYFFNGLDKNTQKAKFRSFLDYFDWLETQNLNEGNVKISRKVMTGKQWLTIEDWLECGIPLCSLDIKHEGRLEKSNPNYMQVVFANSRLGGDVLASGSSQESTHFFMFPEMLAVLLYVEALEDNESLNIENVRQISRIINLRQKGLYERIQEPENKSVCCIDAEDYSQFPHHQFEEDNILRELNKCLLAFRQNTSCPTIAPRDKKPKEPIQSSTSSSDHHTRLSPIGELSTPSSAEASTTIFIRQATCSTKKSSIDSQRLEQDINKRRSWLVPGDIPGLVSGPVASGRRGRFIILGSSGECLPVSRKSISQCGSLYSSCNSSNDDEFHSAKGSSSDEGGKGEDDDDDISEDEGYDKRYSKELDTPERRNTFAQKLKDALKSNSICTDSTEDSYAVGISVAGSNTGDQDIKVRRGGSHGFVLTEDSLDEEFYKESMDQEKEWLTSFRTKQKGPIQRKDTNESSKYSFSTELSSELEEVYEQLAKWLDDPILCDKSRELDPRDEAVLRFASSLLKRTLSESFVGVPLTDGCVSSAGVSAEETSMQCYQQKRNKTILSARSLSLELAKHKHKLAAQLSMEFHDLQMPPKPPPRRTKKTKKMTNKQTSKIREFNKNVNWTISHVQSEEFIKCDDVTLKISQIAQKNTVNPNLKSIATGNWGCGESRKGDVQLKLVIQWMAASVAGVPSLLYYTAGHEKMTKLDTLCRVLLDRKWTVGELAAATLHYAHDVLQNPNKYDSGYSDGYTKTSNYCFFDKLIGLERTSI